MLVDTPFLIQYAVERKGHALVVKGSILPVTTHLYETNLQSFLIKLLIEGDMGLTFRSRHLKVLLLLLIQFLPHPVIQGNNGVSQLMTKSMR
jgi:hypothetical protein